MEEEKAAAYYDELSRKGEGAAKFKQGLGFSSSPSNPFSSKPTSASLLSSFVPASNPSTSNPNGGDDPETDHKHRARVVESIHSKLSRSGGSDRRWGRSPSDEGRERRRERYDERERRGERSRERRRRRSRSYSPSRVSHSRDRDRDRNRGYKRERDSSSRKSSSRAEEGRDYAELIEGYSQMTPVERVKAKMKLQLSQTAAKDPTMGTSTGWERFDFNKDAPLDDDDDEHEVAEDDHQVVKNIGRSFRFSAVEARREEEVKAAHDQAMFGGATASSTVNFTPETIRSPQEIDEGENDSEIVNNEDHLESNVLISDKVLSMQQGSWRDRARRLQNGSEKS